MRSGRKPVFKCSNNDCDSNRRGVFKEKFRYRFVRQFTHGRKSGAFRYFKCLVCGEVFRPCDMEVAWR